jgi:hypothetical protein
VSCARAARDTPANPPGGIAMRLSSWWMPLATLFFSIVIPCVFATDLDASKAGGRSVATQTASAPDEVTVTAQRLLELEVQIYKAEDRFYDEYNRVNKIPEFQTNCGVRTDGTTRMNYHTCTPRFVDDASEYYSHAILQGEDVGPPILTITTKMPAYRKHVHEIADKDPELVKKAQDFQNLTKQYAELHKRKFERRQIAVP